MKHKVKCDTWLWSLQWNLNSKARRVILSDIITCRAESEFNMEASITGIRVTTMHVKFTIYMVLGNINTTFFQPNHVGQWWPIQLFTYLSMLLRCLHVLSLDEPSINLLKILHQLCQTIKVDFAKHISNLGVIILINN